MSLGEEIVRLRNARVPKMSQGQLALKVGIDRAHLSQIENDVIKNPSTKIVIAIAQALAVDEGLLFEAAGYRKPSGPPPEVVVPTPTEIVRELTAAIERQQQDRQRFILVPIVKSIGAAGEGAIAEQETIPYSPTSEEAGHRFIAIRVKGDCLSPRVRDGDTAVIDKDAEPTMGNVVAVDQDGESLLRIWNGDQLLSLNGHAPIPIDVRTRIEGVVVFAGKRP